MDGLEEKKSVALGWWPPFVMETKNYDFGLSEKASQELNRVVYKARLQYVKECADAESKMMATIQNYLREQKIWKF